MSRPYSRAIVALLLLFALLNLGCASAIGYSVGNIIDTRYARELPIVDEKELTEGDTISLHWLDGTQDVARVTSIDSGMVKIEYNSQGYRIHTTLLDLKENPSLASVKKLKKGRGARTVGISMGTLTDVLIIVLLALPESESHTWAD